MMMIRSSLMKMYKTIVSHLHWFKEKILQIIGFIVLLLMLHTIGIALFGGWFKADDTVLKHTAKAQANVGNALLLAFHDAGRLDIRYNYSVHAYISKKNYMHVPYPDRDEAIAIVGKAWCNNKGIIQWYMPELVLRDIATGEDLGSYRCIGGFVGK